MRYLFILGVLGLAACTSPTGPNDKPHMLVGTQPVCPPGTHKRITAVTFNPPPAHVIAWVCIKD